MDEGKATSDIEARMDPTARWWRDNYGCTQCMRTDPPCGFEDGDVVCRDCRALKEE